MVQWWWWRDKENGSALLAKSANHFVFILLIFISKSLDVCPANGPFCLQISPKIAQIYLVFVRVHNNCKGQNISKYILYIDTSPQKVQETKMLVTFQRFGDLFLFGLVWQYSSVQTKYNKGRFKVMPKYLLTAVI